MLGYSRRSTAPCRNGPNCQYFQNGTCWFYHPDWHQNWNLTYRDNRAQQTGYNSYENYNNFGYNSNLNMHSTSSNHAINLSNYIQEMLRRLNNMETQNIRKTQEQLQQSIKKPTTIILNGKQIQLIKIESDLNKDKAWFFKNTYHFLHFSQCQYQECSICLENFQQKEMISALFCKHSFHHECIKNWLKNSVNCPLCRKDFRTHAEFKTMPGYKQPQNTNRIKWQHILVSPEHQDSYSEYDVSISEDYEGYSDGENQYIFDDEEVDYDENDFIF